MIWWRLGLVLVISASVGAGAVLDDAALRDSMMVKGSLMGQRWLEKNGFESYLLRQSWKPTEDSGLRCVGRWSYGPSLKVSLRVTSSDSVICLTRGSGATLARFRSRDSVTFDLLGDLNFAGIPRRAIITDTLVVAGIHVGGTGLEVHGVSDPTQPHLLSRVDLPVVNDIAVKDSFVYAACEDDTLRIYNIANPRLPVRVGACRDSCDLFMAQAGNYCYLVHVSGVNIVDVGDPASPHRAGHIGGGEPLAVYVRDTLCYVTVYQDGLRVWNTANVGSPVPVGSLSRPDAMDLTMAATCDTMLYTSYLDVISVADPASPVLIGTLGRSASGVAALPALDYALLAVDGLTAVDIATPSAPQQDTYAFSAGWAVNIALDGTRAYVGMYNAGVAILDVADPTRPMTLGGLDYRGTLPTCNAVAARDSFAFLSWEPGPQFQTALVSNPEKPELIGGDTLYARPDGMVLRDSLAYCAMWNRFQVVNVARPREPVLIGTCVTGTYADELCLTDTLAYISGDPLRVINVARPDNPLVVGNWSRSVDGLDVVDTVLYAVGQNAQFWTVSVADPGSPRPLDSITLPGYDGDDVVVVGSTAYVGEAVVRILDVSDPGNLRITGQARLPASAPRLVFAEPYLFACCGGVCVLEAVPPSIAECDGERRPRGLAALPSITSGRLVVEASTARPAGELAVFDVTGKEVMRLALPAEEGGTYKRWPVDVSRLSAGVYVLRLEGNGVNQIGKVVITRR